MYTEFRKQSFLLFFFGKSFKNFFFMLMIRGCGYIFLDEILSILYNHGFIGSTSRQQRSHLLFWLSAHQPMPPSLPLIACALRWRWRLLAYRVQRTICSHSWTTAWASTWK
jgi:hypothetical protein